MSHRIVYGISKICNSGPSNVLVDIIRGLDKSNLRIEVLVFGERAASDDRTINILKAMGCHIAFKPRFVDGASLRFTYKQAEVFHAHCIRSLFYFLLAGFKNLVVTSHNMPFQDWPMEKGAFAGRIIAFLHDLMIRKASKVVAISTSMKDHFSAEHMVLNGVDTDRYRYDSSVPLEYDFVFCGRLIERKQPFKFVDLLAKSPGSKGVILGDGPSRNGLEAEIARLGLNIKVLGKVDNPDYFYKRSRCYVSPSLSEGMPLSVLEAACCGCALYLSKISPHEEILDILSTGRSAHQILPFSDGEYPTLNAPSRTMKEESSKEAREVFSLSTMSSQYMKIYLEMMPSG